MFTTRPEILGTFGVVSSTHWLASAAGMAMLEAGGNAFDAAVAVSAALSVVEPAGSGLGGGGLFLLHREEDGLRVMIDGREVAPSAAEADMYLDMNGDPIQRASRDGPLAAGIPGLPAVLVHLAQHYGRLPLSDSLQPAIRYASEGFEVSELFGNGLRRRGTSMNRRTGLFMGASRRSGSRRWRTTFISRNSGARLPLGARSCRRLYTSRSRECLRFPYRRPGSGDGTVRCSFLPP